MIFKKLSIIIIFSLLVIPFSQAAFDQNDFYLDPASKNVGFYDCNTIEPVQNSYICSNPMDPCIIEEGATYWICAAGDNYADCPADSRLHSDCYSQENYLGTPPPSISFLEADYQLPLFYLAIKVDVPLVTSESLVHLRYTRDSGSYNILADGYFEVQNNIISPHSCSGIDTSASGACSPNVVANDNLIGWHGTGGIDAYAEWAYIADRLHINDSSSGLTIGLFSNPLIPPVISVNNILTLFNISNVLFNGDLTMTGILGDYVDSIVYFDDNVNFTETLVVDGPADIGDAVLLQNEFDPVSSDEDIVANFDMNVQDNTTALLVSVGDSLETDELVVKNNLILGTGGMTSNGDVRTNSFRGALIPTLNCAGHTEIVSEIDGSVSVILGGSTC